MKKAGVLFAFGVGLPYFPDKGMKNWEDLITVEVKGLSLPVRSIHFCVTNKAKGSGKTKMADPSPVVQFYAKKTGREYMELITFRKVREVGAGKQECRIAFYDPVSVWKGGGFQDLKYPSEWKLYYSLNGVAEAKEVAKPKKFVAETGEPKLYKTIVDYGRAYKERYAAEHALWKTAKVKRRGGTRFPGNRSEGVRAYCSEEPAAPIVWRWYGLGCPTRVLFLFGLVFGLVFGVVFYSYSTGILLVFDLYFARSRIALVLVELACCVL